MVLPPVPSEPGEVLFLYPCVNLHSLLIYTYTRLRNRISDFLLTRYFIFVADKSYANYVYWKYIRWCERSVKI